MKIQKSFFCLLLFTFSFTQAFAQNIGSWKSCTSQYDARDLSIDQQNQTVWVGTTGGLFSYQIQTDHLQVWTNIDGLESIHITSVLYDSTRNGVWIGADNGTISFLDVLTSKIKHLYTLSRIDEFEEKSITNFTLKGDSVLIGTSFGLAFMNTEKWEIIDLLKQVGYFSKGIACTDILVDQNTLQVSTSEGVAKADLSSLNLHAPNEWQILLCDGILQVNSLTKFNNQFYACAENGFFKLVGDSLKQVLNFPTIPIQDLCATGETLYCLSKTQVILYNISGEVNSLNITFSNAKKIGVDKSLGLWIAHQNPPLYRFSGNALLAIKPNTINFNKAAVLGQDHLRRLWVSSSATNADSKGVSIFENSTWRNYDSLPAIGAKGSINQFSVLKSTSHQAYFGTWGNGLVKYDGDEFFNYNTSNSPLIGPASDTGFVKLPGLVCDDENSLWLTGYMNSEHPLIQLDKNQNWQEIGDFGTAPNSFPYYATPFQIAIDELNRKWIGVRSSNGNTGRGIVVYFDKDTPGDCTDDTWLELNTNNGRGNLPSNNINDIEIDRDGSIWFVTDSGFGYFFSAYSVTTEAVEDAVISNFLLDEEISSFAIDGVNRKWVGTTSSGIWWFNADASEVIAHYTTENSPLLSNNILDLLADPVSGKVYVGTENGISVLQTIAIEEKKSLSERLKIFPNPFVPSKTTKVYFDGLAQQADIKILTISGKLIKTIHGLGGRMLSWDGKNEAGGEVSSGIYIVVATSSDGNQVALGKLAIIKK